MTNQKNIFSFNGRYFFIILIFTACFVLLAIRLIDLMLFKSDFLKAQGDVRSLRIFKVPAYRGMITDRHGEPLAISTPVGAVWVNPQDIDWHDSNLKKVAGLLDYSTDAFYQLIKKNIKNKKEFVYLKRGLQPDIVEKIRALHVKGIYDLREFRRFYPEGETTAHLIGFTNIDGNGQEGIELAFERWLSGKAGRKRVLKDRLGHIIADVKNVTIPKPGHDLALSIDRQIQYIVYRELKSAVKKLSAKSGTIVVMNVHNGEVLAMANYPAFNPNILHKVPTEYYRNRAVTDMFEPGSVMKPFSIASALLSGKFRPYSVIDTAPSRIRFGQHVIHDERPFGKLTVSEILMHSSNVGVAKLVLASDKSYLLNLLIRSGFGQMTQSGFPGESPGLFFPNHITHPFVLATVGFGYGLSVTTLQLAHAFTAFGNKGKQVDVTLVKRVDPRLEKKVFPPMIADEVLKMMEQVVTQGTGKSAAVPGYRVAGKTGTARIATRSGYDKDRHVSSFVGIVPVSAPKLVIAVMLNEPQHGKYYASQTAAPLFSKIATDTLRVLNIIPDGAI